MRHYLLASNDPMWSNDNELEVAMPLEVGAFFVFRREAEQAGDFLTKLQHSATGRVALSVDEAVPLPIGLQKNLIISSAPEEFSGGGAMVAPNDHKKAMPFFPEKPISRLQSCWPPATIIDRCHCFVEVT